jgi:hypothetical protein
VSHWHLASFHIFYDNLTYLNFKKPPTIVTSLILVRLRLPIQIQRKFLHFKYASSFLICPYLNLSNLILASVFLY